MRRGCEIDKLSDGEVVEVIGEFDGGFGVNNTLFFVFGGVSIVDV